jgi:predicted nucleic acid-binding protein
LLNHEPGDDKVLELLQKADEKSIRLLMNKVNLLEVYYGYLKVDGEAFAEQQLTHILSSNIEIIDVLSDDLMRQAGKLKRLHKRISLANAFVVAQTIICDDILVTTDHHELDVVDRSECVGFLWIR